MKQSLHRLVIPAILPRILLGKPHLPLRRRHGGGREIRSHPPPPVPPHYGRRPNRSAIWRAATAKSVGTDTCRTSTTQPRNGLMTSRTSGEEASTHFSNTRNGGRACDNTPSRTTTNFCVYFITQRLHLSNLLYKWFEGKCGEVCCYYRAPVIFAHNMRLLVLPPSPLPPLPSPNCWHAGALLAPCPPVILGLAAIGRTDSAPD